MMDIPPPDPSPFPWRGRIGGAAADVAGFFERPDGYLRFVRHCMSLAEDAGGVDGFVVGSEMVALNRIRDGAGIYPAVAYWQAIAAEATAGDIRVCDSELHITLAPLSSPHRTHAAQALCEMLDQTATLFPGSRLRMRFAVRSPPRIGLAFPGSRVERSATTAVAPVSLIGAKTGHSCTPLCQEV